MDKRITSEGSKKKATSTVTVKERPWRNEATATVVLLGAVCDSYVSIPNPVWWWCTRRPNGPRLTTRIINP